MATLEEIYGTVLANDEERAAFTEAAKTPEGLAAFLQGHGCDATPEQVAEFLKAKQAEQGEMSDTELESVAGGCNAVEGVLSVVSAGISCIAASVASAAMGDMRGDKGQLMCDIDY